MSKPEAKHTDIATVRKMATVRSFEVFSAWSNLAAIVESHEMLIWSRWKKKSRQQRRELLIRVLPDISTHHRPDFEIFRNPKLLPDETMYTRFLFPYINLVDLIEGRCLTLFISSRAKHLPHRFVHSDVATFRLAYKAELLKPEKDIDGYTIFLDGNTPQDYARIVSWNDDPQAEDLFMAGIGFMPGQGCTILATQERILVFLLHCCHQILHDHLFDHLQSQPPPDEIENRIRKSLLAPPTNNLTVPESCHALSESLQSANGTVRGQWSELATMTAESPFRLPAALQFNRLEPFASARLTAAKDHIWMMREDPAYFNDLIGDWSEHQIERIRDERGKLSVRFFKQKIWDVSCGAAVKGAYENLVAWDMIHNNIVELSELQKKYSDVIGPSTSLPSEFLRSILYLKTLLFVLTKRLHEIFITSVLSSPPLRSLFVRSSILETRCNGCQGILATDKCNTPKDSLASLLIWLARQDVVVVCGLPTLVDKIERELQTTKQRDSISSHVAGILADLGLVAQLEQQIDLYNPWAATFWDSIQGTYEDLERWELQAEPFYRLECVKILPVGVLGNPSQQRFYYPSDKRTEQNVANMRRAEAHLDMFWEAADRYFEKKTNKSLSDAYHHLFSEQIVLDRTPEWIEPVPRTRKAKYGPSTAQNEFVALPNGSTSMPEKQALILLPRKKKVKTKGKNKVKATVNADAPPQNAAPQEEANDQPLEEVILPEARPALENHTASDNEPTNLPLIVTRRTFKTLSTIFYTPKQSDHPGEVAWQDFLLALSNLEFEIQHLNGSAWQFTPPPTIAGPSIIFHDPHPTPKMPFRNARRIGRRLSRAYGWHIGRFEVKM